MKEILERTFWGNSVYNWAIAAGIMLGLFILVKIFSKVVIRRIKRWSVKTASTWDDFLVATIERFVIPLLYLSSVYSASHSLHFPVKATGIIHTAYLCVFTFFILRIISSAFRKFVATFVERQGSSEGKMQQANGLIIIVNILIWVLGVIFLVDNLGYDVTTLIAGLGIGGIAIALAAQAILGDLFSYFVIFFDRPFEIGDFVIVDDKSGTIEQIGIKTTRIRTLSGEQLICSNTDLTNARVHNYKRLEKRRIIFHLGVTYQTRSEQLKMIPEIVKNIITAQPGVDYDRGNFATFGDSSLNFEFVYYVLSDDYAVYMSVQEAINLAIFEQFEQRGIEFAYPTQTLFVQQTTGS